MSIDEKALKETCLYILPHLELDANTIGRIIGVYDPAKEKPIEIPDKLHNMMLAHLDGVYKFSAREDCDELVTQLIKLALNLTKE